MLSTKPIKPGAKPLTIGTETYLPIKKITSHCQLHVVKIKFFSNQKVTKIILGFPSTNYINASMIKFSNYDQSFIATQAPKTSTFANFWRMIIEHRVSIQIHNNFDFYDEILQGEHNCYDHSSGGEGKN